MLLRKCSLILLLLCLSTKLILAQEGGDQRPYLETVIPPSPTASAFSRAGNVPINLFTGQLQYKVPIYTINLKGYSFPIDLSHSSTGLRVQEAPTRTGIGWNLNATGVISRTIRGVADEDRTGLLGADLAGQKLESYLAGNMEADEKLKYELAVSRGKLDSESDVFSFNANGLSGRIVFDNDKKPHVVPYQKIKVEPLFSPTGISNWKLTDEDGNIYEFSAVETSDYESGDYIKLNIPNAWYLTKITPATGGYIGFYYEPESLPTSTSASQQEYVTKKANPYVDCSMPSSTSLSYTTMHTQRLARITWPSGEMLFNNGKERQDLPVTYELGSIIINDSNELRVKSFEFGYANPGRLILKSVTKVGRDGTTKANPYTFDYYGEAESYPSFDYGSDFYKQDHWGYYNNNTVQSLLPRENISFTSGTTQASLSLPGADRSPDFTKSVLGQLRRITYPTKGYTEVDYEGNDRLYEFDEVSTLDCDNINRERSETASAKTPSTTPGEPYVEQYKYITLSKPQCVKITYSLYAKDQYGEAQAYVSIAGPGVSWGENVQASPDPNQPVANRSGTLYLTLEAGAAYSIEAFAESYGENDRASASLTVEWTENPYQNQPVGGVRVARTRDYAEDGATPITRTYIYRTEEDPLKSSGVLFRRPVYSYDHSKIRSNYDNSVLGECQVIARTGNSQLDLSSTMGHHIGYRYVTELIGENGKGGKVTHRFLLDGENDLKASLLNSAIYRFPFPPTKIDYSWAKGKEIEKKTYGYNGTDFFLISRELTIYSTPFASSTSFITRIPNLKIGILREGIYDDGTYQFGVATYNYVSDWQYLKDTHTTEYFPDGQEVTRSTNYLYGSTAHLNPTQIQETSSSGKTLVSHLKYLAEYSSETAVSPLQVLIDLNILNKVVEKQVKEGGGVSGQIFEYGISSANTLILKNRFLLDNSSTAPQLEIPALSSLNYKLQESFGYGNAGEVIGYRQRAREDNAITWDATNTYVLSLTKNARHNQVFHTSFEDVDIEGAGAKTGKRYHIGSYAFSPPADFTPVAGSTFSYWSWSDVTGKWSLVEQTYSGGSVICNGDRVDEVRITPPGAQMTTFTYDPLVGMTSMTDANGRVTYYEYDGMGRLKSVKDEEGNLVQGQEYHYAGQ